MSVHLENKDLTNAQQMEVAVNGPDGATHLILCTGIANLGCVSHDSYTFLVGPQILRRQFVRAIASGSLSAFQAIDKSWSTDHQVVSEIDLMAIDTGYDDESGRVKVTMEVLSSLTMTRLAINYNVSILAELPIC